MSRFYSATAQPTTLSAACTNSATTIQVTATTGFPAVEFILALDYGGAAQELVKVTNVAGTTLTVVRGFDSTTAQSHAIGAVVTHVHSADDFRLSRTHEAASTGVHGATGALVGTTDAQALSNKDLTAGTNTFPASLATDAEVTTAVSNHAALTATHGATGAVVGTTNTQTLSGKTVDLGSNTVTGTTAQFNAALSDNDFATLAGAETLSNKTLAAPVITGVGEYRTLVKAVTESVASSTVLQNDDEFTFSVVANAKYQLEVNLAFDGSSGASPSGVAAAFAVPAAATYTGGGQSITVVGAASGTVVLNNATTTGVGTPVGASIRVLVTVGANAGSVTLQWAQANSNATASRVLAGSWATIRRVG